MGAPLGDATDEDLVHAANRGDADALAALYLRYRDWALSLAYRFTGNPETAQDVAQEAFVYLLSKFPGFQLRARLTTVLYPAIRNTALAYKRKKQATPMPGHELEVHADPGALSGPDPERRAALAAAVAGLPVGQREVLLMKVVDDMTLSEISLVLGIPEGTVKSRLHHALARLRDEPGLNPGGP